MGGGQGMARGRESGKKRNPSQAPGSRRSRGPARRAVWLELQQRREGREGAGRGGDEAGALLLRSSVESCSNNLLLGDLHNYFQSLW